MSAIQNLQPFGEAFVRRGAGPGPAAPPCGGPAPWRSCAPGPRCVSRGGGRGGGEGAGLEGDGRAGGPMGARRGGAGADGLSPQTPLLMQVRVMTCFLPALRTTSI